jgi:hypothetical protein
LDASADHIGDGLDLGVMIRRLLDGLTDLWVAALDARRALSPRSPVAVLDRLLIDRARKAGA